MLRAIAILVSLFAALVATDAVAAPRVARAAVVTPGGSPELGPDEGHVLLVLDAYEALDHVRFTPAGEYGAAFAVEDAEAGISAFLLRLPAGDYCLASFHTGNLRWKRKDKSKPGLCFGVTAAALNFPGQLFMRYAPGGGIAGWQADLGQLLARMSHDYPQVLAAHSKLKLTGRGDQRMPSLTTRDFAAAAFAAGDAVLGADLLQRAADAGDASAMLDLGLRFLSGEGLREDSRKGLAWLDRADRAGAPRAAEFGCSAARILDPPDPALESRFCLKEP